MLLFPCKRFFAIYIYLSPSLPLSPLSSLSLSPPFLSLALLAPCLSQTNSVDYLLYIIIAISCGKLTHKRSKSILDNLNIHMLFIKLNADVIETIYSILLFRLFTHVITGQERTGSVMGKLAEEDWRVTHN